MKVFLINGSPKDRRSNTYRLSSAFLEGLKLETETEVREVCASKLNIKSCLGCFACWNQTPGKCCMADDMASVIDNILWADVIVWSFPLYYFSVPGPLKNLIDRQLPLNLPFMTEGSESGGHPSRYDMSGKRHVVISTCGFYTAKGNYDGVDALFTHMCGKGGYTSIYCGQGELFRVKELSQRTDEYLSWVCKAGAEFASGGIAAQTRENLNALLYPRKVFEAMADASWGIEQSGERSDESLIFTRQMAALYNPGAWRKDLVLEMYYTDLDKRYQILLQKDGSKVISENLVKPTTTIETTYTLWQAIAAGEEDGQRALMEQKYRVRGDFNLMIHWDSYFGTKETVTEETDGKKTNMMLMLLPWILFWSLPAMLPSWGPVIAVYASVVIPLLFRKFRMLVYDHISAAAVTACALLVLLGLELDIMLAVSYLCFGLMWTIGGCIPVPLTANYTVHSYGGEGMIHNPLFIKTNRILTLCWGILYLILPAVSFLAHWFPVLEVLNPVCSLAPAVLGIFTLWFQKWYPAHVARGK